MTLPLRTAIYIMTERCRWTVYFRVTGRVLKIQIIQGWQRGDSVLAAEFSTGPHNRLLRRQHCSSLCSQSEGHEHVADIASALGHIFVGFLAVFGRRNIRAPSLCKQSELQCFASGLRQMFARCPLLLRRTRLLFAQKRAENFLNFEHPNVMNVCHEADSVASVYPKNAH